MVGLGGTGCEIVARVKRMINTTDPYVQFIGFDTDGNWEGTDGLPMVYTSRNMTVAEYLKDVDNWEEWFPDNAMLKVRNMVKGAGQVRPLSRLAFAETISSQRLGKLEKAIRELQVSRGEIKPSNFRIMIVSSFAGGTGSGMFIQTALFLRDYIRKHYGGEVIIRGLFALPDLFKGINSSPVQKESMYANAYAALKELNAINRVCLSNDSSADDINMKIDNLFDSKRDRKRAEKKPFDFIFFVDDVNPNAQVLSNIEDYKQLMTTATYMQVYSPITDVGDSREDNAILTVIGGDGKPLYGGVGASRIVYPYQALVDYCGKKATIESIGDSWTIIDNAYYKADADNKKMMLLDPTVKKLDRAEHFVATVENMLDEGNPRLNFITKATTDITEDGRRNDRAETYYEYVYSYVIDRIRNDNEVRAKANEAGVTDKQLKAKLVSSVTSCETALKDYLETINDRTMVLRTATVQSVIPDDFSSAVNIDSDWNIMKLVVSNGHVVHPLAMRMLLYKFRAMVKAEYEVRAADMAAKYKKINEYFKNAYDDKSTEIVESASDRAGQGGFFAKAKFRQEYQVKSTAQKNRLDAFRDSKFISLVFGEILKRLDSIIGQYERLFDSLEDIKKELLDEVKIFEEVTYTNPADAATYLCSKPQEKREMFESLNYTCSDSEDNDVYSLIFYALYEAATDERENAKKKAVKRLSEREALQVRNEKMGKIFRDSVVKNNTLELATKCADKLDMDVFDALKQVTENAAEIKAVVESAHEKALPYLKYVAARRIVSLDQAGGEDGDCAYKLTFWGINPEVAEKIRGYTGTSDERDFFSVGNEITAPEVVSHDEYSKYEISCYEALYCVSLSEIPKFMETGDAFGVFYENYSNRIRKMLRKDETAFSPHLDIRWYQRNYLPMISDEKNREDDMRAARALWLAMIYNGLPEYMKDGKRVLYASFARSTGRNAMPEEKYVSKDLLYAGKRITINDTYELFKALQLDEIAVTQFIEVFEKSLAEDREAGLARMELVGPRARTIAKRLISEGKPERNALNMIARFVENPKVSGSERDIFVNALISILDEFFAEIDGDKSFELRKRIFGASKFKARNARRSGLERFINFEYWSGDFE